MSSNHQTREADRLCGELEEGVLALEDALLSRDMEALEDSIAHLDETIARWQTVFEDGGGLDAGHLREQVSALRTHNLHSGRLLLADLSWIGAITRWLQQNEGADAYSPAGSRSPALQAQLVDYRG